MDSHFAQSSESQLALLLVGNMNHRSSSTHTMLNAIASVMVTDAVQPYGWRCKHLVETSTCKT